MSATRQGVILCYLYFELSPRRRTCTGRGAPRESQRLLVLPSFSFEAQEIGYPSLQVGGA